MLRRRRKTVSFRRSRRRWRSWYRPPARHRPGDAVVLAAAVLVVIAVLAAIVRIAARTGPDAPYGTAVPAQETTPGPAGPPTESPADSGAPARPQDSSGHVVPVLPTQTATPSPTPTATPARTARPAMPSLRIASREALIDLYRWMIDSGVNAVDLDDLSLSPETVAEVTDKFSNYFEAYSFSDAPPRITVVFKTGLSVLLAIQLNATDRLDSEQKAIAQQAQAVVASLIKPGMTDLEKELAIHDYVADHCEYLLHSGNFPVTDARGFFQNGLCQCAGYVDAFRLLGRLAGLEVEMIGGPTTRDLPGSKGHAWNLIRLDGLWYVVDVTWDDMAGGAAGPEHVFFNLPASAFGGTRSWDQSCCPAGSYAASIDGTYYYSRPEYMAGSAEDALRAAVRQIDAGGSARVYFTGGDYAEAVASALETRYGANCRYSALSADLKLPLYKFTVTLNSL